MVEKNCLTERILGIKKVLYLVFPHLRTIGNSKLIISYKLTTLASCHVTHWSTVRSLSLGNLRHGWVPGWQVPTLVQGRVLTQWHTGMCLRYVLLLLLKIKYLF